MSTTPRVALVGATGNLGPAVLNALLDAGFPVTVLTRSSSSLKLPEHPNQTIKTVDYDSRSSLEAALQGVDVVISNIAAQVTDSQKLLIDASIAVGVKRFLPSEFGNDISNPFNARLPLFKGKVGIREYLKEKVSQHPDFSYTFIITSAFLDWGIEFNIILNAKAHTATLYDGGDRPFSVTRVSTIGQGVVAIIRNLPATANQQVAIHDGVTTQNKLIEIAKKVDGKEWTTQTRDTTELVEWSVAEFIKPGPDKDLFGALVGQIYAGFYKEGYGGDFTGTAWNKRLGLPELTDAELEAEVVEIYKKLYTIFGSLE